MKDFYREVIRYLEHESGVLATVVSQAGSSPRGLGAQMLVKADGGIVGTVGGGRLEAEVIGASEGVLKGGEPKKLEFRLTGRDVADTEMICGGEMEVLLEPIGPQHLPLFQAVLEVISRDQKGLLFTLLPPGKGKAFMPERGEPVGDLPEETLNRIKGLLQGQGHLWRQQEPFTFEVEGETFFVEPVYAEPTLYLFGGGHIALKLAPLARMVGFRVVVFDDRAEFSNRERFPCADEALVGEFERASDRISPNENSYLVIVTRGHLHDYTVLRQFLRSPARYIGMIGSRRKRDLIYHQLLQDGFREEELERVHAPIGLDIGAETPEEIAVSIVAEMIKVRRSSP